MKTKRNPKNLREWQEAADAAELFLQIDSARSYGLITGGPVVDVDRCEELLKLAARRKIRPNKDGLGLILQGLKTTGGQLVEKPR